MPALLDDDRDSAPWGIVRVLVWSPRQPGRRLMSLPSSGATLETAYTRIRETLQAKDVSTEHLRHIALKALERAREQIELDRRLRA